MIGCFLIVCQEWQQECRELLEVQEKDRAVERHQMAIQRQRQELEERQQEEQRHIMTRYWKGRKIVFATFEFLSSTFYL